jgi:hypothetical protein
MSSVEGSIPIHGFRTSCPTPPLRYLLWRHSYRQNLERKSRVNLSLEASLKALKNVGFEGVYFQLLQFSFFGTTYMGNPEKKWGFEADDGNDNTRYARTSMQKPCKGHFRFLFPIRDPFHRCRPLTLVYKH